MLSVHTSCYLMKQVVMWGMIRNVDGNRSTAQLYHNKMHIFAWEDRYREFGINLKELYNFFFF